MHGAWLFLMIREGGGSMGVCFGWIERYARAEHGYYGFKLM